MTKLESKLLEACKKAIPWLITLENLNVQYKTLSRDIEALHRVISQAEWYGANREEL